MKQVYIDLVSRVVSVDGGVPMHFDGIDFSGREGQGWRITIGTDEEKGRPEPTPEEAADRAQGNAKRMGAYI